RDLEHDPAMRFKQRLEGAGIVSLHGHRCLHPHVRLAVCMVIRRAAGFVTTIRMNTLHPRLAVDTGRFCPEAASPPYSSTVARLPCKRPIPAACRCRPPPPVTG